MVVLGCWAFSYERGTPAGGVLSPVILWNFCRSLSESTLCSDPSLAKEGFDRGAKERDAVVFFD